MSSAPLVEEALGRQAPVPGPPKTHLVRPRPVQQTRPSAGREHEIQRLIRDLAALAARRRGSTSGRS